MTCFQASDRFLRLMRRSAVAIALLAIVFASGTTLADDAPAADAPKSAPKKAVAPKFVPMKPAVAVKTLTQKGLKKLKPTPTSIPWVLADDAQTCEKLADFVKVAAAQRAAAKKTKQESGETSSDRETLAKAEARYSELKGYSDKPDTIPQKITSRFRSSQEMMQALQQDLNNQVTTINALRPKLQGKFVADMPPALKTAITDWMAARNDLILAFDPAKPVFDDLDKRYRVLSEDADVATALKSLGKKNHLGSPEFEQIQKGMADAETTVLSGEVPFYREGSLDSVGAILNEKLSIALRIDSVNPQAPSWLPTEVLTKAGITVDAAAPTVTLKFSGNGNRTIQCRQIVLPKLRIGKYVLENLKFLAMPDDAKDLGSQLAGGELKTYDQTPDRETWLYKFAAKPPEAKPDEPKPDQPKPDEPKTDASKPNDPKPDDPKPAKPAEK